MGFRFRKRIKLIPGVYINVGKNGISSASIGKRGASLNISGKGTKATVGIPGTGLSWTKKLSGKSASNSLEDIMDSPSFHGLVIHSKEYMKSPYRARKAWLKGGGKVHYGWLYKFSFLLFWFIAAFLFEKSLPGLSLILFAVGIIRFLWRQPKVNFSIQEHLNSARI